MNEISRKELIKKFFQELNPKEKEGFIGFFITKEDIRVISTLKIDLKQMLTLIQSIETTKEKLIKDLNEKIDKFINHTHKNGQP